MKVHWRIPFASLKKTQYRIDIYDKEYDGDPVILTASAQGTPCKTQGDTADEPHKPVRTQTGNISIVDEDGTLLRSILPANNLDRNVRLVRVSDSRIMWQGFLSCDVFTQGYNARPKDFTININSVLAAMDSLQIDYTRAAFKTVRELIADVLDMVVAEGASISSVVWPALDASILDHKIDTTILFDEKQQDNEEYTSYEAVGCSTLHAMEIVAGFMGWVLQEESNSIYFIRPQGDDRYYSIPLEYLRDGEASTRNMTEVQMQQMEWRGKNHSISTRQGAKSVEVVAKVTPYELNLSVPGFPAGEDVENYLTFATGTTTTKFQRVFVASAKNQLIANKYSFINGDLEMRSRTATFYEYSPGETPFDRMFADAYPSGDYDRHKYYDDQDRSTFDKVLGAFMVKIEDLEDGEWWDSPAPALYLSAISDRYSIYGGVNYELNDLNHIFEMHTVKQFSAQDGWLRIMAGGKALCTMDYEHTTANYPYRIDAFDVYATLKFGDKYWNDSTKRWQGQFTYFPLHIVNGNIRTNYNTDWHTENNDGYFIPIPERMTGCVELRLHHVLHNVNPWTDTLIQVPEECYFTNLEVTYEQSEELRHADRTENHYYQLLGTNFREEVSVSVEIASWLNNRPSPSIILDEHDQMVKSIPYVLPDGESENRRPERDLLARLTEYYGQVRRKIALEVDRPTTPLPLVRMTGYDGKTYLPLAESRDWQTDTSTITCFESPE